MFEVIRNCQICKDNLIFPIHMITKKYSKRIIRNLFVTIFCKLFSGLTEGLHQAGVAECRWAIEKDAAAAHAFRRNYPSATVFTEDCNKLLNRIINVGFKLSRP